MINSTVAVKNTSEIERRDKLRALTVGNDDNLASL